MCDIFIIPYHPKNLLVNIIYIYPARPFAKKYSRKRIKELRGLESQISDSTTGGVGVGGYTPSSLSSP
jgi:hypothetical protein